MRRVTGREAVQMIRSVKPDLIFLDIQMPEMDGFEVTRKWVPKHAARGVCDRPRPICD